MFDQATRMHPYFPLRAAIEIAKPWTNQIVEIGGIRSLLNHPLHEFNHPCCNDGHSTYHFAESGARVETVDISQATIDLASREFGHNPRVTCTCMDGLDFLRLQENQSIDFLFLDAVDANYTDSSQWHLDAFRIASQQKFKSKAFMLIDDTDVTAECGGLVYLSKYPGGKGELVHSAALDAGWRMVFTGRQTLYVKGFQQ